MSKKRLLELDALRGIAAIAVVFFHYFHHYNNIYGHSNVITDWSYYGQFGVQLFFMVSGFVIFWTINRTEKPLDFIISRISRLYPAYCFAVFLTFSVVAIFSLPGREVTFVDAVFNLLMFQEYLKVPNVDGVYWTLTVELTFYFWIFLLYLSSTLKHVEKIFSFIILISIFNSLGFYTLPSSIYVIFLLKHLSFFLAGICFYKLSSVNPSKSTYFYLLFSLASTLFTYSIGFCFLFICFYIIFYCALFGYLKFLSLRPLVFLGSISYSLYLIHQNIGYVIINKFYSQGLNPYVGIVCAIFISLIIASLMARLIEVPAMRYIRNKYKSSLRLQRLGGWNKSCE